MKILLPLALITAIVLIYAVWGRDWLKRQEWAQGFFSWVEPIELALYKKSETILAARTLSSLGVITTFLTQFKEIDLSPIIPFVPEKYQPFVNVAVNSVPMLLTLLGWMMEKLRNKVTKPLELVAVPEAKITPEVAVAIAAADEAKEQAVAVVKAS